MVLERLKEQPGVYLLVEDGSEISFSGKKPIEGLVALDINVGVNEIIEAAKMSVKNGQAVKLPLK